MKAWVYVLQFVLVIFAFLFLSSQSALLVEKITVLRDELYEFQGNIPQIEDPSNPEELQALQASLENNTTFKSAYHDLLKFILFLALILIVAGAIVNGFQYKFIKKLSAEKTWRTMLIHFGTSLGILAIFALYFYFAARIMSKLGLAEIDGVIFFIFSGFLIVAALVYSVQIFTIVTYLRTQFKYKLRGYILLALVICAVLTYWFFTFSNIYIQFVLLLLLGIVSISLIAYEKTAYA